MDRPSPPTSARTGGVVAVVLAAGLGRRFGATKPLAHLDGRPLVEHVLRAARAAALDEVIVVVGHDAGAVADAVERAGGADVVVNPAYAAGQSTSLAAGIDRAEQLGAEVAVVLLADQPRVTASAIRDVADAAVAGAAAARAAYEDGPSHPVAFRRELWPRLRTIDGDRGARELLRELDVRPVPVGGLAPDDVDTPDDLGGDAG